MFLSRVTWIFIHKQKCAGKNSAPQILKKPNRHKIFASSQSGKNIRVFYTALILYYHFYNALKEFHNLILLYFWEWNNMILASYKYEITVNEIWIFSWYYKDLKQLSVKPQGRENSINILLWQYKKSSEKIFVEIILLCFILNHIHSV
jgi:hypothetical protein